MLVLCFLLLQFFPLSSIFAPDTIENGLYMKRCVQGRRMARDIHRPAFSAVIYAGNSINMNH